MEYKITNSFLLELWKHGAEDYAAWLIRNINVISKAVGIKLINEKIEQHTGIFNVEIKAEDESGNTVLIANQLEKNEYSQLKKLITSLARYRAGIAIVIVAKKTKYLSKSISILNKSGLNFYLLLEEIKFDNNFYELLITKIAGSRVKNKVTVTDGQKTGIINKTGLHKAEKVQKEAGIVQQDDTNDQLLRLKFWEQLLALDNKKHSLFLFVFPTTSTFITSEEDKRGISYRYRLNKTCISVEIRVHSGENKKKEYLRIFNKLKKNKEEIEKKFHSHLQWKKFKNKSQCDYIKKHNLGGYGYDQSRWNAIIKKAVNNMERLQIVTKEILKKYGI